MRKVIIKTLSFQYHSDEDRMKMLINKDTADKIEFWITRRFYISLLFKLETFLEQLHISNKDFKQSKQINKTERKKKNELKEKKSSEVFLLKNINIGFSKEKEEFIFVFQSDVVEAKNIFGVEKFLYFYSVLKTCYPKKEWGMI